MRERLDSIGDYISSCSSSLSLVHSVSLSLSLVLSFSLSLSLFVPPPLSLLQVKSGRYLNDTYSCILNPPNDRETLSACFLVSHIDSVTLSLLAFRHVQFRKNYRMHAADPGLRFVARGFSRLPSVHGAALRVTVSKLILVICSHAAGRINIFSLVTHYVMYAELYR